MESSIISSLYQVSMEGCVSTLNLLIQQDPLILNRLSLTSLGENPLHISAMLGHLDFVKALVAKKPQLATELDSYKRVALHMASAEGHADVVEVLMSCSGAEDTCLLRDCEGKIPLHYAVMRGKLEVVRKLIGKSPHSLKELDGSGENVFHLGMRFNQLDTLKILIQEMGDSCVELLGMRDNNGGNSLLHLAVMLKQTEIIRYILSIPRLRAEANTENDMGFTALDLIVHSPRDTKSIEIELMLRKEGIMSKSMLRQPNDIPPLDQSLTPNDNVLVKETTPKSPDNFIRRCWTRMGNWLSSYNGTNWLEETRGTLMLVATVISTISFQAATNPPGGVLQENSTEFVGFHDCGLYGCPAGTAVVAYSEDGIYYDLFVITNTSSFIASLTVIFLLICGIPLKNKFSMWLLTIAMCVSLVFMALTYLVALTIVTPYPNLSGISSVFSHVSAICTIVMLILIMAIFCTLRLLNWMVKKLGKVKRKGLPLASSTTPQAPPNSP